ncbi:endonuclease/exonuclease/phosphatase family protein [Salinimicrobium flavum]|uniref:Endonuclease/exonuclease/phosphatase family protein n=1 Tax=Salinimicrobium flavum TaxID=1737065 RepID=A0ABW5IUB0_9FLAO
MTKYIRSFFLVLIVVISILMILLGALSLIHDVPYWFVKIMDFPRLQYLIISLICLITLLFIKRKWTITYVLIVLGLLFSILIQSLKIGPYLLGKKVVPDVQIQEKERFSVKIIIANVLMTNRSSDEFLKLINKNEPHVVLAMEVNDWWVKELSILEESFPYKMEYPLDNAYGLLLYSKLPLTNPEIKFLKHSDVPSFHATMTLPGGEEFSFHGIHPVAPFPSAKYPDNVGEEELALHKVGALVAKETIPSVVAGDFNDVSWSKTTRFFEDQGDLKNVRLGRGLYNTFNAESLVMRWPLDHFFVTEEFRVKEFKRLEKIGSDHFPLMAEFVLPSSD